jgi:hypothetical protein
MKRQNRGWAAEGGGDVFENYGVGKITTAQGS